MIDFLFISNGYGEDAIAAKIASYIPHEYQVSAFPLVGTGKGYEKRGIEVIQSFPPLAGAGVSLSRDLRSGLIPLLFKEWGAMKKFTSQVKCAVVVGDVFPAIMARFALKKKFFFVGTAKSVYVQSYNLFERTLLKKSLGIFVRDEATAKQLNRKGVEAHYVGNPMMDEVLESTTEFPPFDGLTILLLPGSRSDAPQNFLMQVEALNFLQANIGGKVRGITLVPPTADLRLFTQKLEGWDILFSGRQEGIVCQTEFGDISLFLVLGSLGSALQNSTLVFGQAGTANEQAAGAGKPIIAFDLFPKKLSWYRWRQKKLLGKALVVVKASSEALAKEADKILKNRKLYEEMADEGKNRIGAPGGSEKIAQSLKY